MPFYQKRGEIPSKRHIQFTNKKGSLYWEELVSRGGFSNIYSNIYHTYPPTAIKSVGKFQEYKIDEHFKTHKPYHIYTSRLNSDGHYLSSKIPLFYNSDITISKAHMTKSMEYVYRNGREDEILFVYSGSGKFKSNFGAMDIKQGDYIIIPKGVIWQIDVYEKIHLLVIESREPVTTPNRYRNQFGQLLEHAPFSERDIITPHFENPNEDEEIEVRLKLENGIQSYIYQHHPFDLIGWDGYYFPYILSIYDFMPITGKIHQPPPVHQTFKSKGFVVCSFVPRLFDYHPKAIPAPYAHSNVDSDEIIFYVEGEFMSRKGIEKESITYHPSGLPHGPQPGKIEESLGAKETNEIAVMIDTFKPLKMTKKINEIDDEKYPLSWLENDLRSS
tara:strand:+ start:1514 stop:2677 length:1164 start_codon:yes stop_codon:yes gene_type:complete